MNYDITSKNEPGMPSLGKGTECIELLASQVSDDMRVAVIPMLFPALGAHVNNAEFIYPDQTRKEVCGLISNLVSESGMGKGQLKGCVDAVTRKFRLHDEGEFEKLREWQRMSKTKGANKDKPERPGVAFWAPPADVTNPAFIQNAMALENDANHSQYYNMPEGCKDFSDFYLEEKRKGGEP